MGLDCSHDAFHGAYSSFHRFREAVIKALGGEFNMDRGFSNAVFQLPDGDDFDHRPGMFEFFSHSDCDGEIAPETAAKVADELEALLPVLDTMGDGGGHIARNGGYGAVARQFIAGCRSAAAENEPLKFY